MPPFLLALGDDLQRQRGLAGGLRPEDLDDPAAGQPADAERDVEPEGAGRGGLDVPEDAPVAQAHDGALAELPFNLSESGGKRLFAVFVHGFRSPLSALMVLGNEAIIPQNRAAGQPEKTRVSPGL